MSEDFSDQNLRGRSFKGQDLTCVNFSYVHIRGADFSNAIFKKANFSHAIAELQRRWAIGLVIFLLLVSVVSGWISAVSMAYMEVFIVNNSLLVKVKTAEDANHFELSVEYFDTYNPYQYFPPEALLALLAEKDKTILMLNEKVGDALQTAIERPSNSVYTNTYQHLGDTMPEAPKYDQHGSNFGNFIDTAQSGSRQQSIQHNYAPEQRQTLADAAGEIQRLLKQLKESNPAATETEKKAFITAAIAPEHRSRVVRALQAGGEKALEEFLKNPYVNVATAIIKEWQKAE